PDYQAARMDILDHQRSEYLWNPLPLFLPSHPASTILISSGHGRYLGSPNPSCSTRMISRHTSRPIKSANVSGPMGCAMPNLNTSSTASAEATPSITAYIASFNNGIRTRLETNPGASFTSTGVFPSLTASARTA